MMDDILEVKMASFVTHIHQSHVTKYRTRKCFHGEDEGGRGGGWRNVGEFRISQLRLSYPYVMNAMSRQLLQLRYIKTQVATNMREKGEEGETDRQTEKDTERGRERVGEREEER